MNFIIIKCDCDDDYNDYETYNGDTYSDNNYYFTNIDSTLISSISILKHSALFFVCISIQILCCFLIGDLILYIMNNTITIFSYDSFAIGTLFFNVFFALVFLCWIIIKTNIFWTVKKWFIRKEFVEVQ